MSAHQDDPRNPSYCDLDVFQSEVREWAYRNFGTPDDGRTIRLENFFAAMQRVADGETTFEHDRLTMLVRSVLDSPPDAPSWRPLLGAVEELGELAHAHLKGVQGIRHTPEEIADKKIDAVGDVMVYLADYCNREGVSLYAALERAWGEVKHRDWLKNQQSGRVEKIEVS